MLVLVSSKGLSEVRNVTKGCLVVLNSMQMLREQMIYVTRSSISYEGMEFASRDSPAIVTVNNIYG